MKTRGTKILMRGGFFRLPAVRKLGDATAPATGARRELPDRPDPSFLNKSIPLFFISRDRFGFWVARESEGRIGGVFLFRRSALRFAERNSRPHGCATMFLSEPFELDTENRGNRLFGVVPGIRRKRAAQPASKATRPAPA